MRSNTNGGEPLFKDVAMNDRLRVLSFESRKAEEIRSLIARHNGDAHVAAAMKEVPIGMTPEIREFVSGLRQSRFDWVLFMTGVGAEALAAAVETEMSRDDFLSLLRSTRIVVRGPKPAAVLKKWDVPFAARAPEPNTWRELLSALLNVAATGSASEAKMPLQGQTIGIQEYGAPSTDLYQELIARGARVETVSVYQWALPDDVAPLHDAIRRTIDGEFDVVLFTTAQHLVHVSDVADSIGLKADWLRAMTRCVVGSIGPTASERLREFGLPVDVEPSHPHMGHLVKETLEQAPSLLSHCRQRVC